MQKRARFWFTRRRDEARLASRTMLPSRNSLPRPRSADESDHRQRRESAFRRLSMRAFSKTFMHKKRLAKEARGAKKSGSTETTRDQFAELRAVQEAVNYYPQPLPNDVSSIRYKGRDPAVRARMMSGESIAVPKDLELEPRVVRMFVSGTFRDMRFERDCIVGLLNPRISKYCRIHGLHFQCQDMRWAVSELTHDSRELSLQELRRCKARSFAFNFVGIVGNRYGFCPFPTIIEASMFEKLYREASNPSLLDTWFILDENRVPAMYVLRRVEKVLSRTLKYRMNAVNAEWHESFEAIRNELCQAARRLEIEGVFSAEESAVFERGVVEEEIEEGVFTQSDHHQTHIIIRELQHDDSGDAEDGENQMIDPIYFDSEETDPDGYARARLQNLKERCNEIVHESNRQTYYVPFENGLDPVSNPSHSSYLRQMLEDLEHRIIGSIRHNLQNGVFRRDPLFETVRAHAMRAAHCSKEFVGRQELLHSIRNNRSRLVFVTGTAGSGKTFALGKVSANVASAVAKQRAENVVVARFLGATHESYTSSSLLRGIYEQIQSVYCTSSGVTPPEIPVRPKDVRYALKDFLSLATEDAPLMLIIDGIDQLLDGDDSWVPLAAEDLPQHVRLIISARAGTAPARTFLRSAEAGNSALVRTPTFTGEEAESFLDSWLSADSRALQPKQKSTILRSVIGLRDPSPLALRILYEESKHLNSLDAPMEEFLGVKEIDEILAHWFARLEAEHGALFVQTTLALITASFTGLEETELEDLLSLRDDLLAEAYTDFVPPLARFPQRRIFKLLRDLRPFMWLGNWAHREVHRTALDRYDSKIISAYRLIADYFSADSPSLLERPPCKTEVNGEQWLIAQNRFPEAQPFQFETGATNLRKFFELPSALQSVGDAEALEKLVCDLQFIRIGFETAPADLLYWVRQPETFRSSNIARAIGQSLTAYSSAPDQLEEILWLRLANVLEPGDDLLRELHEARMKTPGLHALTPLRNIPTHRRLETQQGIGATSSMNDASRSRPSVASSQSSSRLRSAIRKSLKKKRFSLKEGLPMRESSYSGSLTADGNPFAPARVTTLHGHYSPVLYADNYTDPKTRDEHLVTMSAESIRIWNVEHKELIQVINSPAGVRKNSDALGGNQVDEEDSDNTDGKFNRVVAYVEPGGGPRVLVGMDRDLLLYAVTTGVPMRKINNAHDAAISDLGLMEASNGEIDFVSASFDGTLKVWRGLTGQRMRLISCEAGPILDIDLFIDTDAGDWQALTVHEHEIRVYNVSGGEHPNISLSVDGETFCTAVSYFHEGTLFALSCAENNGSLRMWDLKKGIMLHSLDNAEHINNPFTCLDIFEDVASASLRCVTGDTEGFIKIWDLTEPKLQYVAEVHDSPVIDVTYLELDKEFWVASCASDGQVHLSSGFAEANVQPSSASSLSVEDFGPASCLSSYTDGRKGRWQVASVHDSQVLIRDPISSAINMRWETGAKVNCIAFEDIPRSRNARCVAGLITGAVSVWSIPTTNSFSVQVHEGQTLGVCVFDPRSSDDAAFASAGEDGIIAVHNIANGAPLCRWHAHDVAIRFVLPFREDHTPKLLSGDCAGNLSVWDFEKTRKTLSQVLSRKVTPSLNFENSKPVRSVSTYTEYNSRQPYAIIANGGNNVRVIALDGRERILRGGHSARVRSVSSFADPTTNEQCIISAGKDKTICVWSSKGIVISRYVFDQPIKTISTHRLPNQAYIMVSLDDGQLVVLRHIPAESNS